MDLLTKGQDNDLQKKIIMTLKEVGLTDEELSAAQEFFDFSKDISKFFKRIKVNAKILHPKTRRPQKI